MGVRDVVRQKSLTTVSLPQASRAEIYLLMLQFEVRGLAGHAPWWVGREGGGPSAPIPASGGHQFSALRGLRPHLCAVTLLPVHLGSC